MSCKIDGQDVRVRYRFGGTQDCAVTYGSWLELSHWDGTTLTDMLASFKITEGSIVRETQGIKATRVRSRVIRTKDTLTGTVHAPLAAGRLFAGMRANYVQFEFTFVVTLDVATHSGVITNVETDFGDDTMTQNITVECDAD